MNKHIPNIITIGRILLIPLFVLLFFRPEFIFQFLSLAVFAAAALSDYWDGYLARRHKIITNFGKFLDPLADKLLVLTAYLCFLFIPEYKIPIWIFLIIVFREFSLTGLRMLALSQNKTLRTSRLGKLKTASQMTTIIIIIVLMLIKTYLIEKGIIRFSHYVKGEKFWHYFLGNFWGNLIAYAPLALIILSALITLYSGIMYIAVNKHLIRDL